MTKLGNALPLVGTFIMRLRGGHLRKGLYAWENLLFSLGACRT